MSDLGKQNKGAFRLLADRSADAVGSAQAFVAVIVITVAWALSGFVFHFSDTWQLIINTFTNIVTLLIVVLIQSTQNRDARAIHLKLDEIIRSQEQARNSLIDVEDLSDEEIEALQKQFERIQQRDRRKPAV
jgi:low affinity Fe/Cu permease